ncbi:MAG: hypothetical protein ACJ79O_09565 [Myxococcales bacterium]
MFESFGEADEMRKRRAVKIAVVAVLLLGCFFLARRLLLPPVPSHRGDGTFHDISWWSPLPTRGYSISMPDLDLATAHQLEYRLADLTDIGRPCGVYLVILDHDQGLGRDTKQFDGHLQLELIDSQNRPVVDVSGRLGDFIWWGWDHRHGLYQPDRSFFTLDEDEEYRLRVSYAPDPRLAGYQGFVSVRSGGIK